MKIIVCGGRNFHDSALINRTLTAAHRQKRVSLVATGGAKGADRLAARWAKTNGISTRTFHPDWDKHGKAAGPIRNGQMLDETRPEMVIAFEGGRGTRDMLTRAHAAHVQTMEVTSRYIRLTGPDGRIDTFWG